ncbi:A24 family peptidase [Shewanella nanhaiensis]|uniref:A24 family peptidase n=1 Tax=Shewanella nanhaiensis TaxID=2864872 RepID=A0ABS7E6F3_9GAMM|nr:A24 family peptidase [Shewanella nanhaiensis]MBW8184726.1 A24 family peptidase [Shewanella nanhaiensis]
MAENQLTVQLLLSGLFFIAAIGIDLYKEKIPNILSLLAIFSGFAINSFYAQLAGLLMAFLGLALAFVVLFPTFLIRVLGAGDIKLMMGIGTLMGPELLFSSLLYGIVAGVGTTVLLTLWKTGVHGIKKTIIRYWQCFYLRSYFKPDPDEAAGQKVPYAPALALGWLCACALDQNVINLYQLWHQHLLMGVT